jgi:hypothetical protein
MIGLSHTMHTASPLQTQNGNTKEIIAVNCENNMKPINIIYGKITEVSQLRLGAVLIKELVDL